MSAFNWENIFTDLLNQFGEEKLQRQDSRLSQGIMAEAAIVPEVLCILRDQYAFNHLANLTVTDFEDEFEVIYHLYQIPGSQNIVLKSRIKRVSPNMPSVTELFPTADWQEREAFDLMGVTFTGHPNLIRVLLPDDFEGHPLRKDFNRREWQEVISGLKGD
ncbi:MAG: NADH-quinone oxidoreductase subunit C [Syntrophomonadaceae bacterium]|jgi:NADH-quinone oxidoreductase subunit C|nr:NADH-quinone oxidoreductase subunit C [Syntrophomonadaceae bacterium]